MKTKILLMLAAAGMLAAALPLATAEQECFSTGPTEAIPHPARPAAYIYLDLTHPEKLGEWRELNNQAGLQTMDCFRFGIRRFAADLHETDLQP